MDGTAIATLWVQSLYYQSQGPFCISCSESDISSCSSAPPKLPFTKFLFLVSMDKISRCSQVAEVVKNSGFGIPALLFYNQYWIDLQLTLAWFALMCEAVGVKIRSVWHSFQADHRVNANRLIAGG